MLICKAQWQWPCARQAFRVQIKLTNPQGFTIHRDGPGDLAATQLLWVSRQNLLLDAALDFTHEFAFTKWPSCLPPFSGSIHYIDYSFEAYWIGFLLRFVWEMVGPNDSMDVLAFPFLFKQIVCDDVAGKIFTHSSGPLEGQYERLGRVRVGQMRPDGSGHQMTDQVLCMQ